MTKKERFEQLKAEWKPEPGDNPNNHWFYSSYFAFKSLLTENGLDFDLVHDIFHQAISWASSEQNWDITLHSLQTLDLKPMPCVRPYYYSKPCFDENAPREIFKQQFKIRFPDKRLNSKFAREKWEELKDKAKEIALEQFKVEMDRYNKEKKRHDDQIAKKNSDWEIENQRIKTINETIQTVKSWRDQ